MASRKLIKPKKPQELVAERKRLRQNPPVDLAQTPPNQELGEDVRRPSKWGGKQLWQKLKATITPTIQTKQPRTFSLGNRPSPPSPGAKEKKPAPTPDLSASLADNRRRLERVFHLPLNNDITIREFTISSDKPLAALLIFIDGISDIDIINDYILEPLMEKGETRFLQTLKEQNLKIINKQLLPGSQVKVLKVFDEIVEAILTGVAVLFVDGEAAALEIEARGGEHRAIERPQSEIVIRGPQDAFNEVARTNIALIRRRIKSPDLIIRNLQLGQLSRTDVFVLYVKGLTNRKLVREVFRRLNTIKIDNLHSSGALEHFIIDNSFSFFSTSLSTERPDRVAAGLSEGQVAIIVDNEPFAILLPATFSLYIQTPEDYYLSWPFSAFLRVIRFFSVFIALLLPALYIAIVNYHQEMLPTNLILSIAGARETIPLPAPMEIVLLELAFELIREGGTRIPSPIGPTIGIVGALVLGQAAVAANIVSPIPVIITSITALGSFTIPNYNSSYTIRVLRFIFIFLAWFMGFYGMASGIIILAFYLVSLSSFGVPFMSPIAPLRSRTSNDVLIRAPLLKMENRPVFLRPENAWRQAEIVRRWDRPNKGNKQSPPRKKQ